MSAVVPLRIAHSATMSSAVRASPSGLQLRLSSGRRSSAASRSAAAFCVASARKSCKVCGTVFLLIGYSLQSEVALGERAAAPGAAISALIVGVVEPGHGDAQFARSVDK